MKRLILGLAAAGLLVLAAWLRYGWPEHPPRLPATVTFAVIGDTESHRSTYERALAIAKERGASFVLHTGDVSMDGTADQLREMRALGDAAGLTVVSALGSHDMRDDAGATFRAVFNDPNLVVNIGNARLVVLDNADRAVGFSPATLTWFENDARAHPRARYLIAFHRPFGLPLQAVVGDDETPTSRQSNEAFVRLLRRVRVSAIFTGHLHIYLPYSLEGIPVYVTGGGGGEPQTVLGSIGKQADHLLLVHLQPNDLAVEYVRLDER